METPPYFGFVLETIMDCFKDTNKIRVLDYGCGDGGLVRFLLERGIDAYGVDVDTFFDDFYSYTDNDLLKQKRIAVIDSEGKGGFGDRKFDFVVSNMVVEHIKDKPQFFCSLARCMTASGYVLIMYPVLESIREGHIRQIAIHWFPKGPLRTAAAYFQKYLAIPKDNGGTANIHEFVREKLEIVNNHCFYNFSGTIDRYLREVFTIKHSELEFFKYRAKQKKMGVLLLFIKILSKTGLPEMIFKLYTGAVILGRIQNSGEPVGCGRDSGIPHRM